MTSICRHSAKHNSVKISTISFFLWFFHNYNVMFWRCLSVSECAFDVNSFTRKYAVDSDGICRANTPTWTDIFVSAFCVIILLVWNLFLLFKRNVGTTLRCLKKPLCLFVNNFYLISLTWTRFMKNLLFLEMERYCLFWVYCIPSREWYAKK